MEIKVLFFGVLAELTMTNCKHYMGVKSFSDLKGRMEDEYPEIIHYNFRYSLNNVLVDNDPVIKDGDEVALMPPFAGG